MPDFERTIAEHTVEYHDHNDFNEALKITMYWRGSTIFLSQKEDDTDIEHLISLSHEQARQLRDILDEALNFKKEVVGDLA